MEGNERGVGYRVGRGPGTKKSEICLERFSGEGDRLVGEGDEGVTISLEELVHVFDPVETEGVKECREGLENHENTNGGTQEDSPDGPSDEGVHGETVLGQTEIPEDGSELGVSKRQGPETEVGSGVGNGTENELNSLNDLMDESLAEVEGTAVSVTVTTGSRSGSGLLVVLVENGVGLLVHGAKGEGLDEEHGGNADEGDDEESDLELRLTGEDGHVDLATGAEEHKDHRSQEQGCAGSVGVHVGHLIGVEGVVPLDEDETGEVSEEREQEGELRDALEEEIQLLVEVDRVEHLHAQTEAHVHHTNDDGHLHLYRVVVDQFVLRTLPHPVNTELVRTLSVSELGAVQWDVLGGVNVESALSSILAVLPRRRKDLHRH